MFCETITVPTANYIFTGIQFQQHNPGNVYAKNVKLFFNAATVGLTEDSWIKKAIKDSNTGWKYIPVRTTHSTVMGPKLNICGISLAYLLRNPSFIICFLQTI